MHLYPRNLFRVFACQPCSLQGSESNHGDWENRIIPVLFRVKAQSVVKIKRI